MKNHMIVDDAQENAIVDNILSSQTGSEDITDRETLNFKDGMKKINEIRNNPIDNDL